MPAPRRPPPAELCHRPRDVARYTIHATRYMLAIYASLGLALVGVVPIVWTIPVVVVAYARGALLTHELMHVRRASQVSPLLRLMMLFDTPFGLGYREYQRIHMLHHRHGGARPDPEHYQIAGSRGRAFLGAMASSEVAMLGWLRRHGLSRALAGESLGRAAVFGLLVAMNPAVFLAYWLTIRATIGVANFAFHHLVHSRAGRLGDYRFETLPVIDRIVRLVLGRALSPVLFEHPAHHAWPRVRAEHLAELLAADPAPVGAHHSESP